MFRGPVSISVCSGSEAGGASIKFVLLTNMLFWECSTHEHVKEEVGSDLGMNM